jgi:hypothetical protein
MEKSIIFCGSAKIINTKYGNLTKVSFSQKNIDTLQANMANGWINLVIKEKKTKVDGKPTHYLEVDSWKKEETKTETPKEVLSQVADNFNDLPF